MEECKDPNIEVARSLYNGSSLLRALGFARVNHSRLKPGNEHEILGFFLYQIMQNGANAKFVPREYLLEMGKDPQDLATWDGNTLLLAEDLTAPSNLPRTLDELAHEVGVYLATKRYGSRDEIPIVDLNGPRIHFTHYLDNIPFYSQAA